MHRCSIFCKDAACIAEVLEDNHVQCLTDMVVNRTQAMSGAIEILLKEKQECLEPDIVELLKSIKNDIQELGSFIRRLNNHD